jgi:hypothetical protein
MVPRGRGKWKMRNYCLVDIECQSYKMKGIMEMDGGDPCTYYEYILYH